jgi:hypothetical protein
MATDAEQRERWIRRIAESAGQDVSRALGLLEGADDPRVREAFRPLVQQLEAVHGELRRLAE